MFTCTYVVLTVFYWFLLIISAFVVVVQVLFAATSHLVSQPAYPL